MQKHRLLIIITIIGCLLTITSCNKTQQVEISIVSEEEPFDTIELETPEDVLIYKGRTFWIHPETATIEAELTKELLESEGIQVGITGSEESVRDWMLQTTGNGVVNICILYGAIPSTIYPSGNAKPNGSIAEKWIETTDGDTILNQADYLGYSSSEGKANERGALQNLMDIPDIDLNVYQYDVDMVVTEVGRTFCPSLVNTESDRPFPLDQLQGDWFAEKIFSSDTGDNNAILADPIIVRDGILGRIAIVFHTQDQNDPKGEVAAEIIMNYLLAE